MTVTGVLCIFSSLLLIQAQHVDRNIECPFPEGQDVTSESACANYTACAWTDDVCHMKTNKEAGYTIVGGPSPTPKDYQLKLQKIDQTVTLFNDDIQELIFEVINHENYHVQIKIYDATDARYEVPVPLKLPEEQAKDQYYIVTTSGKDEPFSFSIKRNSTDHEVLFSTVGAITFEDQFLQFTTSLPSTYLYGLGENTHTSFRHSFEPRTTWPLFARDGSVGETEVNHYSVHPYYVNVNERTGSSHSVLFFNSNAMEYSPFLLSDGRPALTFRSIGGIIDLHFFLGPTLEDVNMQYANMVGKPNFPPYFSLGFHLSRDGYMSVEDVRDVRERMKANQIPQDVQTCDINYMYRHRDFTYDTERWKGFPELIDELHNDSVKLTLIVDPDVVIDFDTYPPSQRGKKANAFVKWMSEDLVPEDQEPGCDSYMIGYVWPDNKTLFPDFLNPEAQKWWGGELSIFYETLAFDMIWLDMNEPTNFGTNTPRPFNYPEDLPDWSLKCPDNKWDSPPYPTKMIRVGGSESERISETTICMSGNHTDGKETFLHYDVHNIYGWSETVATFKGLDELFPGKRHALLTRSTYPGSGQYAFHWLGDNFSTWYYIRNSIIGMLEFNLFAISMVGADVCGFEGNTTMELCARWMQLGAFYPFDRNHNCADEPQDPAQWPEVAVISRDVLNLRYQYLPYLYALLHRANQHGNSVVRPIFNRFPTDVQALEVDDQFMWGDGIMVAPVLEEGAVERIVYFPEGNWYDLTSGVKEATGPITAVVDAPLEKIPVYASGGIILPYQEPALTTSESRKNSFGLTVALNSDQLAVGEIFWDDGESIQDLEESFLAFVQFSQNVLSLEAMFSMAPVKNLNLETLQFFGYLTNPMAIIVNNIELPSSQWLYNSTTDVLIVYISVPLGQNLTVKIN